MSKSKEMPGYMTYREAAIIFSLLPDMDAAKAIKATANYFLYGRFSELEGGAAQVFDIMRASIDRDRETYDARVEGGRRGGKASAESRQRRP